MKGHIGQCSKDAKMALKSLAGPETHKILTYLAGLHETSLKLSLNLSGAMAYWTDPTPNSLHLCLRG